MSSDSRPDARASLAPVVPRARARPHTRLHIYGVWFLVAVPTVLILTCGILILVYRQSVFDVIIGLCLVIFCAALGAGATLVVIGLRIDRRLSSLQMDFVSKVSHELKTPLTSIRMFTETLKLGRVTEPEKIQSCLEVITKETDRLSELITRLLSWGQMEAGVFKVSLVARAPKDVIAPVVDAFRPRAEHARAELVVDVPADVPDVAVDEAAFGDALMNLLTNALRYGGNTPRIEIAARARGDEVEIAVKDHGIGIAREHQDRIFDRFYRADERYSQAVGGTGLGLAIARHIVLAHGGRIEVQSRLGQGSTFTIVLPARRDAPAASSVSPEAAR